MKKLLGLVLISAVLVVATNADPVENDATIQAKRLHAARQLMNVGKPDEAIKAHLDPVIRHYEEKYAQESRKVYCSRSSPETLAYMVEAAAKKKEAIAVGPEWSMAYFMKGYVLLDMNRAAEARQNLERALDHSPYNAQYLNELAHVLQKEKSWDESQKLFVRAEECARTFSPEGAAIGEQTRALRGQGYNLVELGKLAEAKAVYRKCLKLDAGDRAAQAELKYLETLQPAEGSDNS